MPRFEVQTTFTYKGIFTVKAESIQQAHDFVDQHCGLSTSGQFHSTLNYDDYNFNFPMKAEKHIGEIKELAEGGEDETKP